MASLHPAYPVFLAFAGAVTAALLSRRAISLLDPGAKAALLDSASRTRLLGLYVAGGFLVLLLWRPVAGWVFLGFGYLLLGVRSVVRLRRLHLPERPARLLLMGNMVAVGAFVLCALIFVLRELR